MSINREKILFLLRNLLKGFIWLAIIIGIFFAVKNFTSIDFNKKIEPIANRPVIIYLIFLLSEIAVGIIPPEIFMFWGLRSGDLFEYSIIIFSFSIISYFAGIIGYFFGRYLNTTIIYRSFKRRFLRKTERLLHKYGLYLIIVAAVTPVPFSGVAMLVGSVRYSFKKYFYYSLFRFLRFLVYSWIIWETKGL